MIEFRNFTFATEGEIFDGETSECDITKGYAKSLDIALTDMGVKLHDVFGLKDRHACAEIYMVSAKKAEWSFVVIHQAFQYFKISLRASGDRFIVYINKIIKGKYAEKGGFRVVIQNMLDFAFREEDGMISRIELIAARKGEKYSGYFYWPEIGFEAEEGENLGDDLPKRFQDFTSRDFDLWRKVGVTTHMFCDRELYVNYTAAKFRHKKEL